MANIGKERRVGHLSQPEIQPLATPTTDSDETGPSHCRVCGAELFLREAGRDVCARCRHQEGAPMG